jgi:hypothetical protein
LQWIDRIQQQTLVASTDTHHILSKVIVDAMSTFTYDALSESEKDFRLLRILDGTGPLEAELVPFEIASAPEYAGVSYRWDTSSTPETIVVNGMALSVPPNVTALLRQIRKGGHAQPSLIWIDCICINQNDTRERNHQVSMMRAIYSSAKIVLVWLGTADGGSDLAMDFMHQFASYDDEEAHDRQARLSAFLSDSSFDQVISGVDALFRRSYWGRIWIIQEVVLARDLSIMCGPKTLEWDVLQNFLTESEDYFYGLQLPESDAYRVVRAKAFFEDEPTRLSQGIPISELIEDFGHHECSNVRDKVYGLLGLSSDKIAIDYNKSVSEIITDVVLCSFLNMDKDEQDANGAAHLAGLLMSKLNVSLDLSVLLEDLRYGYGPDADSSLMQKVELALPLRPHDQVRAYKRSLVRTRYVGTSNMSLSSKMQSMSEVVKEALDELPELQGEFGIVVWRMAGSCQKLAKTLTLRPCIFVLLSARSARFARVVTRHLETSQDLRNFPIPIEVRTEAEVLSGQEFGRWLV